MRQNPNSVNTEAAKRLIKAHLQDNNKEQEEMKKEEDLWVMEEEVVAPKKAGKMEVEKDSDDEEEEEIKDTKTAGKKGKKLHKGSLMPSGGHISWKTEIEKMLQ